SVQPEPCGLSRGSAGTPTVRQAGSLIEGSPCEVTSSRSPLFHCSYSLVCLRQERARRHLPPGDGSKAHGSERIRMGRAVSVVSAATSCRRASSLEFRWLAQAGVVAPAEVVGRGELRP